jgi:hypothetical protein
MYKRRYPVPESEMEHPDPTKDIPNEDNINEPAPHSEMLQERYTGYHTICQTLRDIYHLTDNEEIRFKARLAMAMAKAMNDSIQRYKVINTLPETKPS